MMMSEGDNCHKRQKTLSVQSSDTTRHGTIYRQAGKHLQACGVAVSVTSPLRNHPVIIIIIITTAGGTCGPGITVTHRLCCLTALLAASARCSLINLSRSMQSRSITTGDDLAPTNDSTCLMT